MKAEAKMLRYMTLTHCPAVCDLKLPAAHWLTFVFRLWCLNLR